MTEDTVVMIRRNRPDRLSQVVFTLLPRDWTQIQMSCVHRRELNLLPQGEPPVHAVMADRGRTAKEMTASWNKWRNFNNLTAENLGEKGKERRFKKRKITQGYYKLRGVLCDPFQAHQYFRNESTFPVDASFLNFWLPASERESVYKSNSQEESSDLQRVSTKESKRDQSQVLDNEDRNTNSPKTTGCCDFCM